MKVENIKFYVDIEDIDIDDHNVDVLVTLENGYKYLVVVATHKNLLTLMNIEKSDFLPPCDPMIIVKKITPKIVEEAVKAYAADDGYHLKLYAANFDIETLDKQKEKEIAENQSLIDFLENEE